MGIAVRRVAVEGSFRRGLRMRTHDCSTPREMFETMTKIRWVWGGGGEVPEEWWWLRK